MYTRKLRTGVGGLIGCFVLKELTQINWHQMPSLDVYISTLEESNLSQLGNRLQENINKQINKQIEEK